MMDFLTRKSIFDIIKEAEEDENNTNQTEDTTNNDTSGTDSDTSTAVESPESSEEDYGSSEDFNIDTDIDDSDNTDIGGEDGGGSDDLGSSDSSSASSSDMSEDEPVEANTDIFSSLTAEEQVIKIKELKSMYSDLYSSCDDVLTKINELDTDEVDLDTLNRVSMTLFSLKQYISDYLINVFPNKSYIENDISFNRFLTILNSVATVLEDLVKVKEANNQK